MANKLIQITAYVRNEQDLVLWKALQNKTEWLHKQLQAANSQTEWRRLTSSEAADLQNSEGQ